MLAEPHSHQNLRNALRIRFVVNQDARSHKRLFIIVGLKRLVKSRQEPIDPAHIHVEIGAKNRRQSQQGD